MNEIELLNLVTSKLYERIAYLGHDPTLVKWPNTDLDSSKTDWHIEILVTQYTGVNIALNGSKRRFGCVTVKVLSKRGDGSKFATELAESVAEGLSNQIINRVVFDTVDIKILDHTLSQRQTTTDIPKFQVNANVDYSYSR